MEVLLTQKDIAKRLLMLLDFESWEVISRVSKPWREIAFSDEVYPQFRVRFEERKYDRLYSDPLNVHFTYFAYSGKLTPANSAITLEMCDKPFGVASAHNDQIRIWDTLERSCERTIDCSAAGKAIRLVAFASDKTNYLISLHKAGTDQIRLWTLEDGTEVKRLHIPVPVLDIGLWQTDLQQLELVVLATSKIECFSPVTFDSQRSKNHQYELETGKLLVSGPQAWIVSGLIAPLNRANLDSDWVKASAVTQAFAVQWKGSTDTLRQNNDGPLHMTSSGKSLPFCSHGTGRLAAATGRGSHLLLRCQGGELTMHKDDASPVTLLEPTGEYDVSHKSQKPARPTLTPLNGPLVFTSNGQPVLLQHWRYGRTATVARNLVWGPNSLDFAAFASLLVITAITTFTPQYPGLKSYSASYFYGSIALFFAYRLYSQPHLFPRQVW